jgi:CRISPR-associated exonuclease Cas4
MSLNYDQEIITGVTVQYYVTCRREAWLFAHKIAPDQEDENILMGRALARIKEEKQLDDFPFSNLKFDKISKERGHYVVIEYKKSLKNPEGAKMQLLFYMYLLKKNLQLKKVDGRVISGKTVLFVEGSEENFEKMRLLLDEMSRFLARPVPPVPEPIPFCKSCGYRNYCF